MSRFDVCSAVACAPCKEGRERSIRRFVKREGKEGCVGSEVKIITKEISPRDDGPATL
jgi:hypothetical protein